MNNKRSYDLLLICGILLIAGVLYFLFRPGDTGAWAVVTIDGEETARYSLSQDNTVTFGGVDYNILQISDGTAAVIDANCGDHTCVNTGAISREGETIVCLPHHLTVQIEGGGTADVDAVVR